MAVIESPAGVKIRSARKSRFLVIVESHVEGKAPEAFIEKGSDSLPVVRVHVSRKSRVAHFPAFEVDGRVFPASRSERHIFDAVERRFI